MYLFKDAAGRVIYVGKAVNLRSRVGSYFLKAAAKERRTAELVTQIADLDHVDCPDEVEALLTEARLIKDIRPRFNSDLKDDKTFPYLQDHHGGRIFRGWSSRGSRTRKSVKLYGPFPSAGKLRGVINALQKVFKFRTCSLDIEADDETLAVVPALPAALHQTVHRPVQPEDLQGGVRAGREAAQDGAGGQDARTCCGT